MRYLVHGQIDGQIFKPEIIEAPNKLRAIWLYENKENYEVDTFTNCEKPDGKIKLTKIKKIPDNQTVTFLK